MKVRQHLDNNSTGIVFQTDRIEMDITAFGKEWTIHITTSPVTDVIKVWIVGDEGTCISSEACAHGESINLILENFP
jgi:hypothetical protein